MKFKIEDGTEIKVMVERVRAAAAKCSTANDILTAIFPEAFEEEIEEVKFEVGDIVRATKISDGNIKIVGRLGIVREAQPGLRPGVEFFENINGHDLGVSGVHVKYGYGFYCNPEGLEIVTKGKVGG